MSAEIRDYVIAAQKGDADAFGELYSIYKNEMYRYACIVVGNPDSAEDAVMDTVLEAFKNLPGLRKPESFKGWLFKILNVMCRKHYREINNELPLTEQADTLEGDSGWMEQVELGMELEHALSVLSPDERQIVMMRAVSGIGSLEISETLGISHATVRSKHSRALAKLKNRLEERGSVVNG